jgi:redox-sensitive bicupin YhaK (pirin superfamily)
MKARAVASVRRSQPTIEGAGVHLKRAFGSVADARVLDPFLLFDHFGSANPADYLAGFPWHPHRGIETVTYLLSGCVRHGDSMGNGGTIGSGEVQWMTAGSGIIHEEMPERATEPLLGFQLWVNLPAKRKMTDPRYQGLVAAEIPIAEPVAGAQVRVICGTVAGVNGPVSAIYAAPSYFDVTLDAGSSLDLPVTQGHTAFAYVIDGEVALGPQKGKKVDKESLVVFAKTGEGVTAVAGPQGARFLVASGKPLGEPIAWQGPIVMNTDEELELAFEEYERGTFVKRGKE